MSYRELLVLSEKMKSLGYGRLISLDNFRSPNFELVADILYFFCDRIESAVELSDDISTRNQRVEFVRRSASILASATQIKLKLSNIYKADGYAVKELLKIAHFLDSAQNFEGEVNGKGKGNEKAKDIASDLNALREYTNLGSKIVSNGVKLHNLLSSNEKMMDERVVLFLDEMSHSMDDYDDSMKKQIGRRLQTSMNELDDSMSDLREHKLVDIRQNLRVLQKKMDEKGSELERLKKRLSSLKNIKPAFLEEYEALETQNLEVYDLYAQKFRNLSYLHAQLNKYRRVEHEKEMATRKRLKSVQQKLRQQELKQFVLTENNHGHGADRELGFVDDLDQLDEDDGDGDQQQFSRSSPPRSGSRSLSTSNSNSNSASTSNSASSSMAESTITSPTKSSADGSISDIDDEHLQF